MTTATLRPELARRYAVTKMDGLEVYKIGAECVITIQPSTGYVSVACSWHDELNGCHYWPHRGKESLKEFLVDLNRSYAVGKLFGRNSTEEFDCEGTKADLRAWIIAERRSRDLTAEQAREHWDTVDGIERDEDINQLHGIDDVHLFAKYRDKPCVAWFWDEVWAAFVATLRTEIAQVPRA